MTTEASPKPPPDGRYRPTIVTNSSTLLSQLSFIAESPNENDPEFIEIRHDLRFETDCNTPVLTILKLFIEQLLLLDSKAYILSKDKKQHFITMTDLPTTQTDLQKMFPATILNRRSGNRLVLRITIGSGKSFLELTQLGLITWANRNKLRLEKDIYHEDDVRDCLWIAGRDSQTSKPWLQTYLQDILSTTMLDTDEQTLLNTYRTKHGLSGNEFPPFSIYWRNRVVLSNLTTRALVIRCDSTIQKFFVKFFTRANKSGTVPEQKGRFIPMSVSKNNEQATKKAMDGQNKYLTHTTSIPLIGLSFDALQAHIDVVDSGKETVESIIYRHCLSIEPTAKTTELGRFNLICHKNDVDSVLEFVKTDIPAMWTLLPPHIAHKFEEALQVRHPRLTAGYSGGSTGTDISANVVLDDPQSISSNTDTQWTQPPNTRRPPRYVSVIYKADEYHNSDTKIHRPPTSDNKSRTSSSEKSQTTTHSTSDLSTLVSSIRDDMNREFQVHTELINALKDEITQLRSSPSPLRLQDIQKDEQENIVASLRQEIQELRQSIPPDPPKPSIHDFSQLIASVVESMVPLITDAVRQGLKTDNEPTKRLRPTGSTPTQFRTGHVQPINLLASFNSPVTDQPVTTTTERSDILEIAPATEPPVPSPSFARQSDEMEE